MVDGIVIKNRKKVDDSIWVLKNPNDSCKKLFSLNSFMFASNNMYVLLIKKKLTKKIKV